MPDLLLAAGLSLILGSAMYAIFSSVTLTAAVVGVVLVGVSLLGVSP